MASLVPEIDPRELADELKSDQKPLLLDVREQDELEISCLPGIVHIPLGELEARIDELSRSANIVVVCRTGSRSARATAHLLINGFPNVRNLWTGMNGWSRDVDRTVIQY